MENTDKSLYSLGELIENLTLDEYSQNMANDPITVKNLTRWISNDCGKKSVDVTYIFSLVNTAMRNKGYLKDKL